MTGDARRALHKAGPDAYLFWSDASDAPTSWVLTRAQARDRMVTGISRDLHDELAAALAADDAEWAGIVRDERAVAVRRIDMRLDRADRRDPHDGVGHNRAGPDEMCLTVPALLRAYASAEAHAAFTAVPADIRALTVSETLPDGTTSYHWKPWHPDRPPADLAAAGPHGRVPMTPAEITALTA